MTSGLGMLDASMAADSYSDIRWHAFCKAIIAGTLEATSRMHSLSLYTHIHTSIYAWKRQITCILSLSIHT